MAVPVGDADAAADGGGTDAGPGGNRTPWTARQPEGRGFGGRWRDLSAVGVLVVVIVGLGALLIRDNPTFSRLDELEHFNYVTSLTDRHRIPLPGDQYTQSAMRANACFGAQVGGRLLQRCDSAVFDPGRYPNRGVTAAAGNPPVYYAATAAVAVAGRTLLGTRSLFVPARAASLLWLVLGAMASYALARRAGARRGVATSAALTAALGPMMLTQGTTVNPDSLSLLAGAGTALVWLTARSAPGRRQLPVLALVLSAVVLVKGNFMAIPPALVLAELALVIQAQPRSLLHLRSWSLRRPLGRVLAAAVIAEAVSAGWSYLFIVRNRVTADVVPPPPGPPGAGGPPAPWDLERLLHYAPGSFSPLGGSGFFVHRLDHGALGLLTALINLLVFSGAVVAVMLARPRLRPDAADDVHPGRAVGYLAAGSFVVAAPVVAVVTGLSGSFVAYPPRYSLFVVPLGLTGLLAVSGRRRARLLVVPAVLLIVVELWRLLPPP